MCQFCRNKNIEAISWLIICLLAWILLAGSVSITIECERTLKPLGTGTDDITKHINITHFTFQETWLVIGTWLFIHEICIHTVYIYSIQYTFLQTVFESRAERADSWSRPTEKMKLHFQSLPDMQRNGLMHSVLYSIDGSDRSHLVQDESGRLCPS